MFKKEKIIIWVSWWPDSMYLQNYIIEKFWKENILIAHFNHKFRKESDKEEKFLKEYFYKKWINFVSDSYKSNDFRENNLRKARYDFFKKLGWWKYFLALWHNLTDRIETSFINISRWTWLKWFLNMKKIDKKRKIFRPLLDLPKKEIQKKCDKLNIPYFIDNTNLDSSYWKRNFFRNEIFNKIEKEFGENFFYNFNKIYNQIEDILPNFNIEEYLTKFEWNSYILNLPEDNLKYFIRELLEYFNIYDFRSNVITEIIFYIQNAKWWGFKQYWNLIITKKNNKIYIWTEDFLKQIWQKIK